ncbi:MAG: hypothetical protein P8Y75_02615 [Nitrospirota bacterium]|jgi:cbb3-type cytochrome oxidase subunit 1
MDRYVKGFIAMSIVYLSVASVIGVLMIVHSPFRATLTFVHSHLMLLGWVSMMIYGVGYHILPRFAGRLLKKTALAEAQFWMANAGLLGMVVMDALGRYNPGVPAYRTVLALSGILEVASIFVFFYLMAVTLFGGEGQA